MQIGSFFAYGLNEIFDLNRKDTGIYEFIRDYTNFPSELKVMILLKYKEVILKYPSLEIIYLEFPEFPLNPSSFDDKDFLISQIEILKRNKDLLSYLQDEEYDVIQMERFFDIVILLDNLSQNSEYSLEGLREFVNEYNFEYNGKGNPYNPHIFSNFLKSYTEDKKEQYKSYLTDPKLFFLYIPIHRLNYFMKLVYGIYNINIPKYVISEFKINKEYIALFAEYYRSLCRTVTSYIKTVPRETIDYFDENIDLYELLGESIKRKSKPKNVFIQYNEDKFIIPFMSEHMDPKYKDIKRIMLMIEEANRMGRKYMNFFYMAIHLYVSGFNYSITYAHSINKEFNLMNYSTATFMNFFSHKRVYSDDDTQLKQAMSQEKDPLFDRVIDESKFLMREIYINDPKHPNNTKYESFWLQDSVGLLNLFIKRKGENKTIMRMKDSLININGEFVRNVLKDYDVAKNAGNYLIYVSQRLGFWSYGMVFDPEDPWEIKDFITTYVELTLEE